MLAPKDWCVEDELPLEVDEGIMSALLRETGDFSFAAAMQTATTMKKIANASTENAHYEGNAGHDLIPLSMTRNAPPRPNQIAAFVSTSEMSSASSSSRITTRNDQQVLVCSQQGVPPANNVGSVQIYSSSQHHCNSHQRRQRKYIPISPQLSCHAGNNSAKHVSPVTTYGDDVTNASTTTSSYSAPMSRASTYVDYAADENDTNFDPSHSADIVGNLVDSRTSQRSNRWFSLDVKLLHVNQGKTPRRGIDTFPKKLMRMLSQEGIDHIIKWLPHGRAFIIRNREMFDSEVRPRFFKPTKFQSFLRQIHLWQFQRVKNGPDAGAYYHELFLRGKPRLVYWMTTGQRRRIGASPSVDYYHDDFFNSRMGSPPNFYDLPFLP